jgi:hypothetical protein
MRRWVAGVAALVAAAALALPARADDAMWRAFRGRVMFSDVALAPASSFGNAAMMESALRRIARANLEQNAGFWRIHMLVFLDRPAPTGTLVMRAFDYTDARAPRQVRVFEVPVERGDRELRLDDFVVTEAMGFARDVTYQFAVEAPIETGNGAAGAGKAGKADVYAKGVITLR